MSRLEELIAELCPNGVKFEKLENHCLLLDNERKPVTKKDRISGIYPYYGANGIQDYVGNYIFDGTFLLVGEDGSVITASGNPILNWATGKIWVNNHAHILSEKKGTSLRYLYYVLQGVNISSVVRGTPPKLNQKNLNNIIIPVPPLPVQEEIVRILDTFSELTAELTAELAKRKQQYQYYRDKVLSFDNAVMPIPLGDICYKIASGKNKERNSEGIYPVYGSTGIIGKNSSYSYDKEQILVARVGANAGYTYIANGKYDISDNTLIVDIKKGFSLKYIYYQLVNFNINKLAKGGGQPLVTATQLRNIEIPIPPLPVQERIVSILDRFDALCNDLTSGLPAEIEARKKQYEYYRDKLLTFKEAV